MNFVKKPGKVRFKVFPRKFVRLEVLLQVHVTRSFFFFLILCVKQDHDQDVGYDDFMQFVFAWNFLKVSLCCHNNKN